MKNNPTTQNIKMRHTYSPHTSPDIEWFFEDGQFTVIAKTHNWAADHFVSKAKTLQAAIERTIYNATGDKDGDWLVPQLKELLKEELNYINYLKQ